LQSASPPLAFSAPPSLREVTGIVWMGNRNHRPALTSFTTVIAANKARTVCQPSVRRPLQHSSRNPRRRRLGVHPVVKKPTFRSRLDSRFEAGAIKMMHVLNRPRRYWWSARFQPLPRLTMSLIIRISTILARLCCVERLPFLRARRSSSRRTSGSFALSSPLLGDAPRYSPVPSRRAPHLFRGPGLAQKMRRSLKRPKARRRECRRE